jgi:hypothetical protein
MLLSCGLSRLCVYDDGGTSLICFRHIQMVEGHFISSKRSQKVQGGQRIGFGATNLTPSTCVLDTVDRVLQRASFESLSCVKVSDLAQSMVATLRA